MFRTYIDSAAQRRRGNASLAAHCRNDQVKLVDEAPRPGLPGLERADQGVADSAGVRAGVPVGRVITAAHLAALEADPQVKPRVTELQALLAALHGFRQPSDPDQIEVAAAGHQLGAGIDLLEGPNEMPDDS